MENRFERHAHAIGGPGAFDHADRIDDAEAGVCVDEQALLIVRQHFLVGHLKVEQTLVDFAHAIDKGNLQPRSGPDIAAWRIDHADRLTGADDDGLFFLSDHVQAGEEQNQQHSQPDDEPGAVIVPETGHVTALPYWLAAHWIAMGQMAVPPDRRRFRCGAD